MLVPSHIPVDLGVPKLDVRYRPFSSRAKVSVPEASVHKHHNPKTRQHYIRLPDEILRVEPITETFGEKSLTYIEFRQRVRAADRSHHARAYFRANSISHAVRHRYGRISRERSTNLVANAARLRRVRIGPGSSSHNFVSFQNPGEFTISMGPVL